MNTDDRDIESSNPSKNFKVGDVDQLSGFFTPVWESKRRIRSEPPAPPSSKGRGGAPSSRSASERGSSPPSAPDADERAVAGKASKGTAIPRPRGAAQGDRASARASSGRGSTPSPPPASEHSAAGSSDAQSGLPARLPPEVAAVFEPPAGASGATADAAQPAAPRSPVPAAPTPGNARNGRWTPSAAARALRDAGPDLPPAAFLDAEPEFRSPAVPRPARGERATARTRAERATQAAARIHEQLKAKLQAEAAEIEESRLDLDPDTHRDALQALEPSAYGPYPISLLRRLRRTIRLSTPVPDPIRSLISKYDRG